MEFLLLLVGLIVITSLIMGIISTKKYYDFKNQEINLKKEQLDLEKRRLELEEKNSVRAH